MNVAFHLNFCFSKHWYICADWGTEIVDMMLPVSE